MAGQIIKRGKETYLVRVYLGLDARGKRKYHNKTIHGNKKAAEKYLNKVLRELDTGEFSEPSKEPLSAYLERWLETAVRPRVRGKTFRSYQQVVRLYLIPLLGDIRIDKLTPLAIQAAYNKMTEQGLSPRTVRYAHAILRNALEQAARWQMLRQNPAQHVDLPRQKKQEMQALSPAEAKRFLEAAVFNRWGVLFELMLNTGLRPGEALGLKWTDIDFDKGRLHVQRSLSRPRGDHWQLTEPKTARSRRTIPLPPSMLKSLREHKKSQLEERLSAGESYKDRGFVFATGTGEPLENRNVISQYFKPLLKQAGLPETIRLYDLRHTCATLLLAAGENPKVVSERLGHASVTLTLDTYSHVLPDMQEQATAKLEEMLY